MIKKSTLLLLLFLFIFFTFQSFRTVNPLTNISYSNLLGQWQYSISYDSIQDNWVAYYETDGETLEELQNNFSFESDLQNPEIPEPYFVKTKEKGIYPLCLKDTSFILKITSLEQDKGSAKVNFFEFPKNNTSFTYIDRTNGYLRVKVVNENQYQYLTFFNEEKAEKFRILELSETELVILDEVYHQKHLFKRKL